jgi:hypothetical protein
MEQRRRQGSERFNQKARSRNRTLGRDIAIHLVKVYTPYILAFLLGVIVAWQGCGSGEIETVTIEKPVPQIQYVDRWKVDTVRFVRRELITRYDTIYSEKIVTRLDTLLLIDTVSIVQAWLTEVANYDTTISDVRSEVVKLSEQNREPDHPVQKKRAEVQLWSSWLGRSSERFHPKHKADVRGWFAWVN